MTPTIRVRSWTRGSDDDVRSGLLGYLAIEYGCLLLDSIVLRKTAAGRLAARYSAAIRVVAVADIGHDRHSVPSAS